MTSADNSDTKVDDSRDDPLLPSRKDLDILHRVVGEIALFQGESTFHRHIFFGDLSWLVMPAVFLRQYKLVHDVKGRTIGYVSWAEVSTEVEQRMLSGEYRLKPSEWQSGDRALIVQLVCSDSLREKMLGAVKSEVFSKRNLYAIVADGQTGKLRITEVLQEAKTRSKDSSLD